jgi:hypothetical protein
MNNLLEIPMLLKGEWEHLVILTYGADLAFLENALWRQISNRCRNKVILADGWHYLQAYQDAERNGIARYINQHYVFDGIFTPHAAHAKMILLTNSEEGRLLIGSGNMGMQGYASGGEMFTHYEYNKKAIDTLQAFVAARSLLERLIDNNSFRPAAVQHLRYMFENTPWFYRTPSTDAQTICHNLDESMLQQLKRAIGNEAVEEIWILSPFYDSQALALEQLLIELSPKKVNLLVQPGLTSVNPKVLKRIMNKFPEKIFVHGFSISGEYSDAYVHAKVYLVKTNKRILCLQGSPNLSQVAMLRTFDQGNLELANLLISNDRTSVTQILEALDIQPTSSNLHSLDLEYRGDDKPIGSDSQTFTLLGADWDGKYLTFHFFGELPMRPTIGIGDTEIPSVVIYEGKGILKLEVSSEYQVLFSNILPVYVIIDSNKDIRSNPIYVWHRAKLDSLLEVSGHEVPWTATGDLNLQDEELENLLLDLDANLIIDRRSIWQVAQKELPKDIDDDDEVVRLTYTDIDYEQLRHHPKLQQYRHGSSGSSGATYDRSGLQTLLSSILEHFRSISDISYGRKSVDQVLEKTSPETDAFETEEEVVEEVTTQLKNQLATQRRIRRILKNFIQRYLRGLRSHDFQELVGPDTLIKNYTIFSHILWRLFHREEVEHDFLADSLIQIWKLFWGTEAKTGIYQRMDPEFQSQALKFIHGHKSDSQMLASIYYCSGILMTQEDQDLRLELRNFTRRVFEQDWLQRTTETLEATWIFLGNLLLYEPPSPSRIIRGLNLLASYETTASFLDLLEDEFGVSENGCAIERQVVHREALRQQAPVETLIIRDQKIRLTADLAKKIAQRWQEIHEKDYYRIVTGDGQRIFQYETKQKRGSFYIKATSEFEEFGEILVSEPGKWKGALQDLIVVAQILDKQLSITLTKQKTESKVQ